MYKIFIAQKQPEYMNILVLGTKEDFYNQSGLNLTDEQWFHLTNSHQLDLGNVLLSAFEFTQVEFDFIEEFLNHKEIIKNDEFENI